MRWSFFRSRFWPSLRNGGKLRCTGATRSDEVVIRPLAWSAWGRRGLTALAELDEVVGDPQSLLFSLACSAATSSSLMNHFLSKGLISRLAMKPATRSPART
jgi:hypothetical protein